MRRIYVSRKRIRISYRAGRFFFKYKYFEFNNRFGKRKEGTVIGIKFTPLYAVILMDDLEKEILESLLKKRFWW